MGRKTLLISLLLLSLFLVPRSASIAAAPRAGFYGYITLDGKALPPYASLTAWIGDAKVAEGVCYCYLNQSIFMMDIAADNPARAGRDGGQEGEAITFKVANVAVDQTLVWHAGANTRVSLSAVTPPRPTKVRFEGRISAMTPVGGAGDVLWTVAGQDVLVIASTVVEPAGYQPVIGDWALVYASGDGSGSLVAERIQVRIGAIEATPYELRGNIEAIEGAGSALRLTVSGAKVVTDGETQIVGEIALGRIADVRGERRADGSVLARRIVTSAPGEAAQQVEFEGVIEAMQGDWWTVSGTRVWIAGAEIPRQGHVGLTAEVSGAQQADGSVRATYILVEEINPSEEQRFSGRVVSMARESWTLRLDSGVQQVVYLDASSFIDESRAPAAAGNLASVLAIQRQDHTLLALRIRLERPN
ncbi:MAG: hypothetical protein GXY76_16260 [Chloroflexi bacterium]|nr:hypothetical protein [Chloroflexota bacterium]